MITFFLTVYLLNGFFKRQPVVFLQFTLQHCCQNLLAWDVASLLSSSCQFSSNLIVERSIETTGVRIMQLMRKNVWHRNISMIEISESHPLDDSLIVCLNGGIALCFNIFHRDDWSVAFLLAKLTGKVVETR